MEIKFDIWDNSVWSPEGVLDVSRNIWVREHFIWAKGESPQGFLESVKGSFAESRGQTPGSVASGSRHREPWRLALESEKDSCLSGETDFVEAFTPSFDPRAQDINRGAGLEPKTDQETQVDPRDLFLSRVRCPQPP